MKEVTLSKIIGETGVFVDGDWVESKDQDVNGDVRLIQLADIGDGIFINKSNRFLTSEKAIQLKCTFLKAGDLLIARMPDPLGRACIFPEMDMRCVTVVDVCIVRPDINIANSTWLKFLINSFDFRNKINKYVTGTTRQRISRGNLEKLTFRLPEITEQNKVSFILGTAELLIKQRKDSIALVDVFLRSTFSKMFGDPLKNEKGWEKIQLSNVSSKIGSGATPKGGKESYHKEGISLIRSLNVHNDEFIYNNLALINDAQADELKNVTVQENDVLLNITGASVARCCIVPKDILPARVNQHVSIIRPDSKILNPIFLSRIFTSKNYQANLIRSSKTKGATREALTKEGIELIHVIAPPIDIQNKFATVAQKAEILKKQFKSSLNDLEKLFGSLSQKAFQEGLKLNIETETSLHTDAKSILDQPLNLEKGKVVSLSKEEKVTIGNFPFDDIQLPQEEVKEIKKGKGQKSKLTWEKVSTEQAANWIKNNYTGFHFTSEMLVRFLIDEHVTFPDYHSSEDLKKKPQLNEADDLKSLIDTAIVIDKNNKEEFDKANKFIKLEQHFYDAKGENFQLSLTEDE